MSISRVQDILYAVQKPSRYLGLEINSIHKPAGQARLSVALAFPDLYEIGSSHFGIQILYHILNSHPEICAERVFAPAREMEDLLRLNHMPLFCLESQRAVSRFDIIGFSLLYELNYTNVLNMLDLAGIPLRWSQRREQHPLVIAGGPCVCNPEPMADFFDAMVFGDGERVVMAMAEKWLNWRADGAGDKETLLKQWSELEGIYVPRFYQAAYDGLGLQRLQPATGMPTTIRRTIVADLDQCYFPDRPIVPFGRPVHDRLRIEISRGCSRGCRFCQAGMIYRPVRERSAVTILELVRQALDNTGYEDLSLLSLSTSDYCGLTLLMENLMQLCRENRVAVSLPSLRAGSLTPQLMKLIRSIRKTGFTIAPEAGSQRLRDVINKNITFDDVAATVRDAFDLGWRVIKLYFMIGLPTETQADLEAMVDMVRRLKAVRGSKNRKGQINVSITTFVPKAHTPFQWEPQISREESDQKLEYLKKALDMPGVRVKWQHPEMSMLEGILARGDRRLAGVIERAFQSGCRFDGWNDSFDFDLWQQALAQSGIDGGFYTMRSRSLDEVLPWEHMDTGVSQNFLREQWHASRQAELLSDCRHGSCHACGVCDFERLFPRIHTDDLAPARPDHAQTALEADQFLWLELTYTKLGPARLFSHLEISNIFSRALRRAKIAVQYSQGFHPLPRISFDDPLPLGMASQGERMRILASCRFSCQEVVEGLNAHLPEGVRVINGRAKPKEKKASSPVVHCFKINFGDIQVNRDLAGRFVNSRQWPYLRSRNKRSEQTIDLKAMVKAIRWIGDGDLYLEILAQPGITVRPADFLLGVLGMHATELGGVLVTKLYDENASANAVLTSEDQAGRFRD